jgi:hypothetical protein
MTGITPEQHEWLMRPLQAHRVAARKVQNRSLSYLEAWDVRAHLIRIFGFGGFSVVADEAECVAHLSEQGQQKRNHLVSWKVRVTLSIPALGAEYTEYAVGSANLPDLGEAHDMAIKTAESDALKRAAINLGTQFGLSLYNDGSRSDVVRVVLVKPEGETEVPEMPDVPVVAEEEAAPAATEPMSEEQVAEAVGGQILATSTEEWLAELRSHATNTDNSARILAVAALKQKAFGTDILSSTTQQRDGSTITLARLADLVAQGAYLPKA